MSLGQKSAGMFRDRESIKIETFQVPLKININRSIKGENMGKLSKTPAGFLGREWMKW